MEEESRIKVEMKDVFALIFLRSQTNIDSVCIFIASGESTRARNLSVNHHKHLLPRDDANENFPRLILPTSGVIRFTQYSFSSSLTTRYFDANFEVFAITLQRKTFADRRCDFTIKFYDEIFR